MNWAHVPVRLRTGDTIRIDTRPHLVGPPGGQVRVFTEKESGIERSLSNDAIIHMIRSGRVTTDAAFRALSPGVTENLLVDWGAFSDLERNSAYEKYPFVKAVDGLPAEMRDKSRHIDPLIDKIMNDETIEFRRSKRPPVRLVRDWYIRWVVTGRDIRSLVSNHSKKGNREPRVVDWYFDEIKTAVDETYRHELRGAKAHALERARELINLRSAREGIPLLDHGADEIIGKHLVSRFIDKMEVYDLTVVREGRRHADLYMKAVRNGPMCSRPLEEAEVDHTQLDLMVVDEEGRVLGRPWITAIIDRYSRMILGYSVSFTPPSWVSVMEALRVALQPKDRLLSDVCSALAKEAHFEFDYPCFGPIERLFCDNGPEFRSTSMTATERALNMQIVDLPRASGWLKGRIERWFRTLNQGLVHRMPGTTKSNPRDRRKYPSAQRACLRLADVNWIIAKWIVDVYHTRRHSKLGAKPLERWMIGINQVGQPPAPPADLLVALTGKVIAQKLQPTGIQHLGLRWNSNAFSALLNRLGPGNPVTIRIDPLDLKIAYVLDSTRSGNRDVWIEGDLETDDPAVKDMTLYQYEVYRSADLAAVKDSFNREEALARARANQAIIDHVSGLKPLRKTPRKAARFQTDGRNASEHLRGARFSADESENELGSHDHHTTTLLSPPPDERGPYRGLSPTPKVPPQIVLPVERVDVDAVNADVERDLAVPTEISPVATKMAVKTRRLD
ncbi:hypothetical protein AFEL58S_01887 [Afipia felis]